MIIFISGSLVDDSEEEQQSHAERAREDFHTIFHVSEFNGDAERIAYEQYKPYFGRISYNAVSYSCKHSYLEPC